jgi:hypothetical protein
MFFLKSNNFFVLFRLNKNSINGLFYDQLNNQPLFNLLFRSNRNSIATLAWSYDNNLFNIFGYKLFPKWSIIYHSNPEN